MTLLIYIGLSAAGIAALAILIFASWLLSEVLDEGVRTRRGALMLAAAITTLILLFGVGSYLIDTNNDGPTTECLR